MVLPLQFTNTTAYIHSAITSKCVNCLENQPDCHCNQFQISYESICNNLFPGHLPQQYLKFTQEYFITHGHNPDT